MKVGRLEFIFQINFEFFSLVYHLEDIIIFPFPLPSPSHY